LNSRNETLIKELGKMEGSLIEIRNTRQRDQRAHKKENDELKGKVRDFEKMVADHERSLEERDKNVTYLKETIKKRDGSIEIIVKQMAMNQVTINNVLQQKAEILRNVVEYLWRLNQNSIDVLKKIGISPSRLNIRQSLKQIEKIVITTVRPNFLLENVSIEGYMLQMPDAQLEKTKNALEAFLANFAEQKEKQNSVSI
jgi:hypothetical protein